MPALTIYLSRLIGIVTLIVTTAMLSDKTAVVAFVNNLGNDGAALLLLGSFRVVCGAGIVLIHNVWRRGLAPLLVTLTGWEMLLRGVMNLFLPPDVMSALIDEAHFSDFYYLYVAVPLMLGAYLCLRGFATPAPPIEVPIAPYPPSSEDR